MSVLVIGRNYFKGSVTTSNDSDALYLKRESEREN